MNKDELNNIALDEAKRALGLSDGSGFRFERRGGITEWDDGICKNVFRANFRIWKPIVLMDLELDVNSGEVVSWYDKTRAQMPGDGILTRNEAIQIARSEVKVPESADPPMVKNVLEKGRTMTVVIWTLRPAQLAAKAKTLEVVIHPGTRRVCAVRQY